MVQENKTMKHRRGEIDAMYFDKLPQRCKEMFFEFLESEFFIKCNDKARYMDVWSFDYSSCESPIETMFNMAFDILIFARSDVNFSLYLLPQTDINLKNHYRADFLFDSEECDFGENYKPYKLVIECDGHEFHEKTKQQVAKRNNRDMELKMAGYDVLHFSGSQIYNEPFECANTTIDYILSKIQ